MVLLFEYCLTILVRLMCNATIVAATSIAILTHSISPSSIFTEEMQWFCFFASVARSFSRYLPRARHRSPIRRARVCPSRAAIDMIEALL
jgi:hypothetical protein